jgi:hypothetical protein
VNAYRIDEELLKRARIHAFTRGMRLKEFLESAIRLALGDTVDFISQPAVMVTTERPRQVPKDTKSKDVAGLSPAVRNHTPPPELREGSGKPTGPKDTKSRFQNLPVLGEKS